MARIITSTGAHMLYGADVQLCFFMLKTLSFCRLTHPSSHPKTLGLESGFSASGFCHQMLV
jgi:hypothetical protein